LEAAKTTISAALPTAMVYIKAKTAEKHGRTLVYKNQNTLVKLLLTLTMEILFT
jgi:hypothetical protein